MSFKSWSDFVRELEIPGIESLPKEELVEMVYKYEQAISSIANIDTYFMTDEGDFEYTDQEALERVMEIALPMWSDIIARKRNGQ